MNQKRYWLRGGIVGIIIFAIYRLLVIINTIFCFGKADDSCSPVILDVIFWPFHRLSVPIYNMFGSFESQILVLSFVLIFHIMVGVIIGWIYGKIKNKNVKFNI